MKTKKRLEDFPHQCDINKHPLHEVYSKVTFSELRTFDLMRLLYSFQRTASNMKKWYSDDTLSKHKWVTALKKELGTRENLTTHQKKGAYKNS